ncbi:hypothetical protein [Nocardiopsis eucommiae]|uniref:hypothetical protein n=1 Tax=Nocardiopsis eucommiae TaxID=2831970 RepID=UPI003D7172E3
MLDTIAPAPPARAGTGHVNQALDEIIGEAFWLTTTQLAGLIAARGIIGHADSVDASPVGLWVLDRLQDRGIPAVAYSWVTTLAVLDPGRALIGEVRVPVKNTLYDLEREVNDLDHPGITWQGEADPR